VIHYEVTLECSPATAPALERWMRNGHIPDMLATGCFSAIHFDRADGRFRTVYEAATQRLLDRYLEVHADRMREAFHRQFPDGVVISREVWEQVQAWPQP
jgi:hypothetical protein